MIPRPSRPRFFSLKWKALILTSLVLAGVTMFVSAVSYLHLMQQFEEQRQAAHERYARQAEAQVRASAQQLIEVGITIPELSGMTQALQGADAGTISRAFDRHWPLLQVDLGVELVRFYDNQGRALAAWETDAATGREGWDSPEGWVREADSRERPLTWLGCAEADCRHYAAVPLLVRGAKAGVVVLARSLADVVLGLKGISGTDIGLLVAVAHEGHHAEMAARLLPSWGVRVVALTEAQQNELVLRRAEQAEPRLAQGGGVVQVSVGSRTFEVSLLPLATAVGPQAEGGFLTVIADSTEMVRDIEAATRQVAAVGGMGLVLAEALLLAILWTPMSRLRSMALKLPLLARHEFGAVRKDLQRRAAPARIEDEIDVLSATAVELSDQLEVLQQDVESRTRALGERAAELAEERDFVASLLETAQVLILAQDGEGRIGMSNPYAQSLTGYGAAELARTRFTDLLTPEPEREEGQRSLAELVEGGRQHLHHETQLACRDGSTRHVAWYHSRLPQPGRRGATVLSVGLDVTERRMAESRLAWLAQHDSLTGLLNRRGFQESLRDALDIAQRYHHTGALLYLDLDQFKDINDMRGHQAGDRLLVAVADSLERGLRTADAVGRLGGDEFAVLIRETDARGAAETAARILERLRGLELPQLGRSLRISASVGIALFPEHGASVMDLLARADVAMYHAKETGRSRWHLFSGDEAARRRLEERVQWKSRVEDALARGQFVLYLQPVMQIASGRVRDYEVLLRMVEEDGVVTAAGSFIEVAESTGLIRSIDRLVLMKAIPQLAALVASGHDLCYSINLSAYAFEDPDLLPMLRELMSRSGLDPSRLVFEITETAALSEFGAARVLTESIKLLGCRFALDDFGVGFSSLYYLRQLPIDHVKIDGSFIRGLASNPDDQLLVKAITEVARGFGKKTVAEYVQDAETLELLRGYGTDYAQGHLIGEARDARELFPELMAEEEGHRRLGRA